MRRKRISVDNGNSYCTPSQAIKRLPWEEIYNALDPELADLVHLEMYPCSQAAFLRRYLELSWYDIVIG